MPNMNFFKVFANNKEDLISLLRERQIVLLDSTVVEYENKSFTLSLYFSSIPTTRDVKWIKQLQRVFRVTNKTRPSYSAVILVEFDTELYAVSYGVAHHFLSRFSDWEFGLNVAERLFRKHTVKNTREFGGVASKAIVTYSKPSNVPFEPGEAVHFLKGTPFDVEVWGKSVSCGQSVRLSDRAFSLENVHILVLQFENLLNNDAISTIPRSQKVHSKELIEELNNNLVQAMQERNYMVEISNQQLTGVEFLFSDRFTYYLKAGRELIELENSFSLESIESIVSTHFSNDYRRFLGANVEAHEDDERSFTKKMIECIDYVDNRRNFYLQDGKWYQFDNNYLSILRNAVDEIELIRDNEMPLFDENAYRTWKDTTGSGLSLNYREHYLNNLLESQFEYTNFDRNQFYTEGLSIEIADAVKDGDLVHVKIGTAQKMAYLIDQAHASLLELQRRNFVIEGQNRISSFTLWMFLHRQTDLQQLSDLRSLICLMKLARWRTEVMKAGLKPRVMLSYFRD